MDYFRPRGDITTVLDLTDRDAQDNYLFPLQTTNSWFHRDKESVVYPTTLSIQEFPQRGPAKWGAFFSFEIGSLPAGDLLQSIILQIKLGHWYDPQTLRKLSTAEFKAIIDPSGNTNYDYWTYCNSLGTSIIEYAEFIVNDQTLEKITGEFIRIFLNSSADINSQFGIATDAYGSTSTPYLTPPTVLQTAFNPNLPYPTEEGTYFCVLPFFFLRTKLKEVFPLLSCNEGNVRINIKLRSFEDLVRNYSGLRRTCDNTPLNKTVTFEDTSGNPVNIQTAIEPPAFMDFRILTVCSLVNGTVRDTYLRKPFEQLVKISQTFYFDEPLKYVVTKPNPNSDMIEIQLPLELNHPVQELMWVFRRKAVQINNEWNNFSPVISYQTDPSKVYQPWLNSASIFINGSNVITAEGNWFREHIASKHKGGWASWASYIYGYSFSRYPDEHQPSGTANTSRTNSIVINMKVNSPVPVRPLNMTDEQTLAGWDKTVLSGWEVFVFAIHLNWIRFENGICNKIFTD
jgi:hypothetical protein